MTTRTIMLSVTILMIVYAVITTISPTLFGAPQIVIAAFNLVGMIAIIIGLIALIKDASR